MVNLRQIENILNDGVTQKVFPGTSVGVISRENVEYLNVGRTTYLESSPVVTAHTVYDLASITKMMVNLLVIQALSSKQISLDAKVSSVLSNVPASSDLGKVSVQELLTSRVDFGLRLSSFKHSSPAEIVDAIISATLKPAPDTVFQNSAWLVIGWLVAEIYSSELPEIAQNQLFKPLKLSQTSYLSPIYDEKTVVAPTEVDPDRGGLLEGVVHDESAWVFAQEGIAVGSAGIFSTTQDVSSLLQAVLFSPEKIGISRDWQQKMWQNWGTAQDPVGLGWEMGKDWMSKDFIISKKIVGKSGFTGCMLAINSSRTLGMLLLSNAVYPVRPNKRDVLIRNRQSILQFLDERNK